MELFGKQRKVFLKVQESRERRGVETYCDEGSLVNLAPVYKEQVISALTTALELLIGTKIVIKTMRQEYEDQQGITDSSNKASAFMDEDLQPDMQKMQKSY